MPVTLKIKDKYSIYLSSFIIIIALSLVSLLSLFRLLDYNHFFYELLVKIASTL